MGHEAPGPSPQQSGSTHAESLLGSEPPKHAQQIPRKLHAGRGSDPQLKRQLQAKGVLISLNPIAIMRAGLCR